MQQGRHRESLLGFKAPTCAPYIKAVQLLVSSPMAAPVGLEPTNAGVKVLCLPSLAMGQYKAPVLTERQSFPIPYLKGACASIQCPPIVKQTIGKVALTKSIFRPTHFAMGLVLQKAFSGHSHNSTSLLGRGGGIRTHSAVKQRIYSPPRLSNFGAPLYEGGY